MKTTNSPDAVDVLKHSPMFSLSLTSLELFHSNFLYWLANEYPAEVGLIFSDFIENGNDFLPCHTQTDSHNPFAEREKHNFDITLNFCNKEGERFTLIIENKVKSFPDKNQLDGYEDKANAFTQSAKESAVPVVNYRGLLLSLLPPSFDLNPFWKHMSYRAYAEKLNTINLKHDYHRAILHDYTAFIAAFSEITDEISCELEDENGTLSDIISDEKRSRYTAIRMDSFYQKAVYMLLAQKIYLALEKCADIKAAGISFAQPGKNNTKIRVNPGFTRGTGLANFWVYFDERRTVAAGIEIQGLQYRKFINHPNAENMVRALEKDDRYMAFIEGTDFIKKDKVLKFGVDWRYRNAEIPAGMTIAELVKAVVEDIKYRLSIVDKLKSLQ